MQPAPRAIAETLVMTLRPAFAPPRRSPRQTVSSTSRSMPRRPTSGARQHRAGVGHRPLIVERYDPESFTMKVTC